MPGFASVRRKVSKPKATAQTGASTGSGGISIASPNRTGLPDVLKSGAESLSGISLDDVRVHLNSSLPRQLHAFAYTQGTDIHVAPGQERYLPHEAWHVVQQKQGRVQPDLQLGGKNINVNPHLEKEADDWSQRAPITHRAGPARKSMAASTIQGGFWNTAGIVALSLLTGGLGALGYGAYRYYRHRRRINTLDAILAEQAGLPITAVNQLDTDDMDRYSEAVPDNPDAPQHLRTYHVDINPINPVGLGRTDARLRRIAEIHEKTHVAADQTYSANRDRARLYLEHGDTTDEEGFGQHQRAQWISRDARVQTLKAIVRLDSALSRAQRREILERLNYAEKSIEYDPVINELLAYTYAYGIRANSRTVKALVTLARENLNRRRQNGPDMVGNWPA